MASNSRQKSNSSASRRTSGTGSQLPRSAQARGGGVRSSSNNPRFAQAAKAGSRGRSMDSIPQVNPVASSGAGYGGYQAPSSNHGRTRVSSVRIGDLDRDPRGSGSGGKSKVFVVVGVIVVLVCALAFGGLALGNSSLFAVSNIEIKGADHLTEAEVNALAPIPEGTSIFAVDTELLAKSIERDAWVSDAQLNRKFPSTIEIVITEREIGAVVEVTSADAKTVQPWAIAADGMWLMAIPDQETEIGQMISPQIYESAASVLHITDVPYGIVPEMGTYCTDDNVNNALAIVAGMTTSLSDRVRVVSATDAESTLLTLDNGIEIAFGTAENIRDKERICLELMEQYPGKVAYINVRVVDRPTWRSV